MGLLGLEKCRLVDRERAAELPGLEGPESLRAW